MGRPAARFRLLKLHTRTRWRRWARRSGRSPSFSAWPDRRCTTRSSETPRNRLERCRKSGVRAVIPTLQHHQISGHACQRVPLRWENASRHRSGNGDCPRSARATHLRNTGGTSAVAAVMARPARSAAVSGSAGCGGDQPCAPARLSDASTCRLPAGGYLDRSVKHRRDRSGTVRSDRTADQRKHSRNELLYGAGAARISRAGRGHSEFRCSNARLGESHSAGTRCPRKPTAIFDPHASALHRRYAPVRGKRPPRPWDGRRQGRVDGQPGGTWRPL